MLLTNFDPNEVFEELTDELRSYVFFRDNGVCQICGKSASEPHHVIYRSHGGKHCANNIASICNKCHYKIHNKQDKYKELLLTRIKENEQQLRRDLI